MKRKTAIHYIVGIDTGVHTGLSLARVGHGLLTVESGPIHWAFNRVADIINDYCEYNTLVIVEDARKAGGGREKKLGAGSIRRDSKAWDDYLKDLKAAQLVDYQMMPPLKRGTKVPAGFFKSITGWTERTNEHARDAAMIAWHWERRMRPTLKFNQTNQK